MVNCKIEQEKSPNLNNKERTHRKQINKKTEPQGPMNYNKRFNIYAIEILEGEKKGVMPKEVLKALMT